VDALVDDVAGETGGPPLLSTALLDLWRERDGRSLTPSTYQRTGGVRGAVGRHAEAAFRSLADDEQRIARRILLRLVAGGEGEALTRQRVTRAELLNSCTMRCSSSGRDSSPGSRRTRKAVVCTAI
jgi:hypothetical protein